VQPSEGEGGAVRPAQFVQPASQLLMRSSVSHQRKPFLCVKVAKVDPFAVGMIHDSPCAQKNTGTIMVAPTHVRLLVRALVLVVLRVVAPLVLS